MTHDAFSRESNVFMWVEKKEWNYGSCYYEIDIYWHPTDLRLNQENHRNAILFDSYWNIDWMKRLRMIFSSDA